MARIVLDSGGTAVDVGTPGAGGDTLRAGVVKQKAWAADINTMTAELYNNAGGYKPGSIISNLNVFDKYRWHTWFDDFIAGPAMPTSAAVSGWQYCAGFQEWAVCASTAGGATIERNLQAGNSSTAGSWVQVVANSTIGSYVHLTAPDASGPMAGATAIPFSSSTKRYAVAFRVSFSAGQPRYRVGFGAMGADPQYELLNFTTTPGIYMNTIGGVARIHINNYEFISPKSATLPVAITYDYTKSYEFELLYDGALTFLGQYREFTLNSAGSWISLGSVSLAGWQLFPDNFQIGPWIAASTTATGGGVAAQIGVDYLLAAAER